MFSCIESITNLAWSGWPGIAPARTFRALLGRIAIGDWPTALIGVFSLAVLFCWKVSNPALIAAAAAVGLVAFPLLSPTWVMVK
jgi:hypothetical protein